ncbi:hypothetical protein [Sphingosinicella sp. LY1275]|uniref:hypothetical protein n=1 Tax=Sphingosinicella sp. LY1275 TaxID=3095379 RepID=UPI002ADEF66A|nr:hypothetical protein [Sphingosinicella sp. LY1275]MEA1015272.1 hypothetical protein [Sphingosinicella sp. LY1275]
MTVGEKIVAGCGTGVRALKVHVTQKCNVGGRDRIPRNVDYVDRQGRRHCFETDVIETGATPIAFGMRSGDRVRAFDDDLGVAGLTFSKGNGSYVLTNAHVVVDVARGGAHGSAGWHQVAAGRTTPLGPIAAASRLHEDRPNTIDAAAIKVENPDLLDLRMISGSDDYIAKMELIRSDVSNYVLAIEGNFIPCFRPEPIAGDAELDVDGVMLTYRRFWQLRTADGQAAKGLSGAALLRKRGSLVAASGLVFGGIPDRFIWAFSFKPLFKSLFDALP